MAILETPQRLTGARPRTYTNAGPPSSGTAGTGAGQVEAYDLLMDKTYGVMFVNEGTKASPYWTPVGYDQRRLFGVWTDFRDNAGKAIADTAADAIIPGSGVRVFGDGVAETDSGLVPQTAGEGNIVARLTTTNEADHLAALGMKAGVMQPDQHQLLVIEAILTHVTDILTRSMFIGFLGTAADALVAAVTGATTTATLVQDDLAGLFFDTGLTDPDRLYGVHNKSNAAATQDLTADGDTSTNIAAAGTEQRIRVEIDAAGGMTAFVDKLLVYTQAAALDVDEEVAPVLYVEAEDAAIKEMDVRQFAAYAYRAA